jgi:hypothetical protein
MIPEYRGLSTRATRISGRGAAAVLALSDRTETSFLKESGYEAKVEKLRETK